MHPLIFLWFLKNGRCFEGENWSLTEIETNTDWQGMIDAPRRPIASKKMSGRVCHTSIVSRTLSCEMELKMYSHHRWNDLTSSETAIARDVSQSKLGYLQPSIMAAVKNEWMRAFVTRNKRTVIYHGDAMNEISKTMHLRIKIHHTYP